MPPQSSHTKVLVILGVAILFFGGLIQVGAYFSRAPENFPVNTNVIIERGATLREISNMLHKQNVVMSPSIFEFWTVLVGAERSIRGGIYRFDEPISAFDVAITLKSGSSSRMARVVFPEGTSTRQMSDILIEMIPGFSKEKFLGLAESKEGYLFPDTYFLNGDASEEDVVKLLSATFEQKTSHVQQLALERDIKWSDAVIMASLLEEEAQTFEDKRLVSGVLWKRIRIKMALQVDAPFVYILGKGSADLTLKDLAIDSTYNTYKYRGLPPTPISNPGLESLVAAVTPIESPYLFYLSDKEGTLHYARTFEEHVANKRKYLR